MIAEEPELPLSSPPPSTPSVASKTDDDSDKDTKNEEPSFWSPNDSLNHSVDEHESCVNLTSLKKITEEIVEELPTNPEIKNFQRKKIIKRKKNYKQEKE